MYFFFWGGGGGGGVGVYRVHRSMSATHENQSGDFVERSMSPDSSTALVIADQSNRYLNYKRNRKQFVCGIIKTFWVRV